MPESQVQYFEGSALLYQRELQETAAYILDGQEDPLIDPRLTSSIDGQGCSLPSVNEFAAAVHNRKDLTPVSDLITDATTLEANLGGHEAYEFLLLVQREQPDNKALFMDILAGDESLYSVLINDMARANLFLEYLARVNDICNDETGLNLYKLFVSDYIVRSLTCLGTPLQEEYPQILRSRNTVTKHLRLLAGQTALKQLVNYQKLPKRHSYQRIDVAVHSDKSLPDLSGATVELVHKPTNDNTVTGLGYQKHILDRFRVIDGVVTGQQVRCTSVIGSESDSANRVIEHGPEPLTVNGVARVCLFLHEATTALEEMRERPVEEVQGRIHTKVVRSRVRQKLFMQE